MKFIRVKELEDGVEPLRDRLGRELEDGKHVVWLVPGGSNIPLSVAVMAQLPEVATGNLTILLSDERYGNPGHADSNAHQLEQAGFTAKRARFVPVLQESMSIEDTCKQYGSAFQEASQKADVIIGQFGMGADGHIAGVLPGSPAIQSADMAASYATPTFTRITLTPKALQSVTAAYIFAFGAEKCAALKNLQTRTLNLDEQPAQLLKQLPEAYAYNDQIGDKQ